MRRLIPPLIGIPVGLAIAALAAAWIGPDAARAEQVAVIVPAHPPQHAAALPKVGPFPPDRLRPPADATTQASGTGFFVGVRTVITAAHVVSECRSIRRVSQYLAPTEAVLATIDAEHDIAVLYAAAPAPAHLAIAEHAAPPSRALVYGFPATARRDVPDSTWATLVNDRLGDSAVLEKDPRTLLWMQNRDIAQGYSGGPILNPATGKVLGIVRALIDPQRAAAAYGIVTPDLSIGPGTMPLRTVLAGDSPDPDDTDDIFTRARKATVHVFCWH